MIQVYVPYSKREHFIIEWPATDFTLFYTIYITQLLDFLKNLLMMICVCGRALIVDAVAINRSRPRQHDDVMKWKPFPCYWPFVLGLHRSNSSVTGEFPSQRPVTRSFDAFFDLRPNKRLRKQSWGWWFETSSNPLWRHCNKEGTVAIVYN